MDAVINLKNAEDSSSYGGKASNLASLLKAGLPVPGGLAIGLNAFSDDGSLTVAAKDLLSQGISNDRLYAVRSSALAEDAEGASWAGQFESYLDTKVEDIITKIELCHNSAKNRAKAYAQDKDVGDFNIAVVVQEMLKPEYAGVLFTKDPLTGKKQLVVEYVEGLGEELVSGRADPVRVNLGENEAATAPFDASQLSSLAVNVEKLFGKPQDIEWVSQDNKIWLVQARPITTTQTTREGFYLGEPNDLFYWGPSRAKAMYMSDFFAAVERLFTEMAADPSLPNPPKTVALFDDGKMAWLNNAKVFGEFTEKTFEAYAKQNRIEQDVTNWKAAAQQLSEATGDELSKRMVEAWYYTEFAEFSLYGAEVALSKKLNRFDPQTKQKVWAAFSVPDRQTFLARIDAELASSQNPAEIAIKYPWIQDGYDGVAGDAINYFTERLKIVGKEAHEEKDIDTKRKELIDELKLTNDEVDTLTLARKLAEFMDDRKAWMIQTRKLITQTIGDIEHGWFFKDGKASAISKDDAHQLWQRYIEFKASTSAVVGIVASNGGKHFINGEVVVVASPTDVVENGKIIVVPSTSPSYVPLMRNAKALVTDHGGIMSHAAIVAREFNLPCIVGTKQATKILKTGDKIVLDLTKGEVSK